MGLFNALGGAFGAGGSGLRPLSSLVAGYGMPALGMGGGVAALGAQLAQMRQNPNMGWLQQFGPPNPAAMGQASAPWPGTPQYSGQMMGQVGQLPQGGATGDLFSGYMNQFHQMNPQAGGMAYGGPETPPPGGYTEAWWNALDPRERAWRESQAIHEPMWGGQRNPSAGQMTPLSQLFYRGFRGY